MPVLVRPQHPVEKHYGKRVASGTLVDEPEPISSLYGVISHAAERWSKTAGRATYAHEEAWGSRFCADARGFAVKRPPALS